MRIDRRVAVWNVSTGATSVVKGSYPSKGSHFGYGHGEVAIAGKRIALITRFVAGNSQQTQERLYTASVGGSARPVGSLTNHSTNPPDGLSDGGWSFGNWLAGLVGSGKVLAVSTWKSSRSVSVGGRLNLVTPSGLRTIATGPGAIVAQAADRGHIAVLQSRGAWPAKNVGPATTTPNVGFYGADGALLSEIPIGDGAPTTIIRIALSGSRLVVLTLSFPQPGAMVSVVYVYDLTSGGGLVHRWPLLLKHRAPLGDRIAADGRLAVVSGAFKPQLLDLTTGRAVTILAGRPGSPATIGSRGLVYAVNPNRGRPGKLVFVPIAKLLAMVG